MLPTHSPTPSLIFGKYEIIRRLAIGGMGEIFLARQTGVAGFDRLVILKSLLPDLADNKDWVDQFLDEARVAATLNHPNIVGIYEVGLWDGVYFIAMEYIEGENIGVLMKNVVARKEMVDLRISTQIIHDAALGLDHAHYAKDSYGKAINIVHRDISPQNIMVRTDGVTKVVDFGIAKASNRSTRTQTGVLKGKIRYMSPEQLSRQSVDARTDQFALGIVLWEMYAGRRLFRRSEDEIEILKRLTTEDLPPPSSQNPKIPRELDRLVAKMMARDPEQRFARCRDVATALNEYLDSTGSRGEPAVAQLVQSVLGERIKEKTADLTPSKENFFIPLGPQRKSDASDSVTTPNPGRIQASEQLTARAESSSVRSAVPVKQPKNRTPAIAAAVVSLAVVIAGVALFAQRTGEPPLEVGSAGTTMTRLEVPPPAPAKRAAIELRQPIGAKVILDGQPWPKKTPTIIDDLAPGPHNLRIELAGHQPIERVVSLEPGVQLPVSEPVIALPPKLNIASNPSGASVRVGSALLGSTPVEIKTLAADANHQLTIEKAGYVTQNLDVHLGPGEEKKLSVSLARAPKAERNRPAPPPPPAAAPPPPASAPPTAANADGLLSLKTTPWTKVTIDNEPYGVTPLFKTRLAPGVHEVHLVNEEANIDTKRKVTVTAGQTTKLDLQLKP